MANATTGSGNGRSKGRFGAVAALAGAALLVPLAWARIARASGAGRVPRVAREQEGMTRLAREMPGMGKRAAPPPAPLPEPEILPGSQGQPTAEQYAEWQKRAADKAAADKAAADKAAADKAAADKAAADKAAAQVPAPPVPPPAAQVPAPAPVVDAPTMAGWLRENAPEYIPQITARLEGKKLTPMLLCQVAKDVLPPPLIEKLKKDVPATVPDLAICERSELRDTIPLIPPSKKELDKIDALRGWYQTHAASYVPQFEAFITKHAPRGADGRPVVNAMLLCRAVVEVLPGELIDKLEEMVPALAPELALCERQAAAAPRTQLPTEPAAIPPQAAPPVVVDEPAPAPPTPAPAPPAPVVVKAPSLPEPAPATKPPLDEAPAPPSPPPVPMPEAPAVPEATAPAVVVDEPAAQAIDAAPKPPPGFDAAKARSLAPQLAKSVKDKKYGYSRSLAQQFQTAAGIAADGSYGGETRGAIEAFGVRRPPPALFKPTGTVPYKWADHA